MQLDFILFLDLLGTIAFAISGALAAMRKKLDIFGILIVAFVAAIGGGTLRDVLIDVPVDWMRSMVHVYVIIIATALTIAFRNKLKHFRRSLFLFDTIGIGLYTVIGIEKALVAGLSPSICIALGTMTACFGGVLRDILCSEIPVVFHKEIYATACIIGGVLYFILLGFSVPENLIFISSGLLVMLIRVLAVYFDIQLPSIYDRVEH